MRYNRMILTYYGEGCVRLQSGTLSLLVDPLSNRLKADATLRTLTPTNFMDVRGEVAAPNEISFPGEYEIQGIEISGFPITKESNEKFLKTAYRVRWEEMTFVFLGCISGMPELTMLEWLDKPDVLILPTTGGHYLSPEAAAKLVKQLEPSIVVPIFHKPPYAFLKAFGQKAESQEKFVFRKKDIEKEKGKIILLASAS